MTERDGPPPAGANASEEPAPSLPSARRLLGLAPLLVPVVAAPLLGGTAWPPYTLLVAVSCGALALWTAGRHPRAGSHPPLEVSWFGLALGLMAALCFLQLVPLPPPLRALLAPGSDPTLRRLLAEPVGGAEATLQSAWLPLSVDPAATWNEAVRLLGYLCLLFALGQRLRRRGDSRWLTGAVVLAAGAVAALGALASLGVLLPPPLGVPAEVRTRALLPAALHNPNHMAALLSVGAVLTVALLQKARRRLGLLLLLLLLDVALLGTLSRAGIVLGLAAQAVTAAWLLRAAPGERRAWLTLGGGGLGAAVLAIGLLPRALPTLLGRFSSLPRGELLLPGSKVQAWREALPLLAEHWPLGVGRGAFELAFQGHHTLSATTRFVYLECGWLQALLDWGVPAGLGLIGLCGLGALAALRDRRPVTPGTPLRRAALVALLLLAAHDTVDFSLEVGGVAVPAVALVVLCERPRFRIAGPAALRGLLALGALTGMLSLYVAARCPGHDEDGERLRDLARQPGVPVGAVVAAGREAIRRHPLDSYLWATVAARLHEAGDPGAAAWVNRALLANPRDVGARQVGALLLVEHGHREQAQALLRAAITDGDFGQRRWLYQTAARIFQRPGELLAAVPTDPARRDELLDVLGSLQPVPWPLVRGVAEGRLGEEGASPAGRQAASWYGRAVLVQRDVTAAAAAAAQLGGGQEPLLWAGLIDLLIDAGDEGQRAKAAELAAAAHTTAGERPEPLRALGRLAVRAGRLDEARRHLELAMRLALDDQTAALVHDARAELEERAGNSHRAEHERTLAAQRRSGRP